LSADHVDRITSTGSRRPDHLRPDHVGVRRLVSAGWCPPVGVRRLVSAGWNRRLELREVRLRGLRRRPRCERQPRRRTASRGLRGST